MICLRCKRRVPEKKELIVEGKGKNQKNHYWLKCPRCKNSNPIKAERARVILGVQMDLHQVRLNQLWAT